MTDAGYPRIGVCVGHVHFMLFVLISLALGTQCKCSFRWNMGLTIVKSMLLPNLYMGNSYFLSLTQRKTGKLDIILNSALLFMMYTPQKI